jgi:hypothetical protein
MVIDGMDLAAASEARIVRLAARGNSGAQSVDGAVLTRTFIICIVVATLFVGLRTIARWLATHKVALQDGFCWLGYITFLGYTITYIPILPEIKTMQMLITNDPKLSKEDMAEFIQSGYGDMMSSIMGIQVLFWTTLWCVKGSLLIMFRQLVYRVPLYGKIWWGVVIFTILGYIGCIISQFTACHDMKNIRKVGVCTSASDIRGASISLYFGLSVDVASDLMSKHPATIIQYEHLTDTYTVMAIPISLLWNVRMNLAEKAGILIAFSAGIATIIAAFIRAFTMSPNSKDQVNVSWLAFWAAVEGCIALCVNSIPSFAIFVRGRVQAHRSQRSGGRSGNSANKYGQMGSGTDKARTGLGNSVALSKIGHGETDEDSVRGLAVNEDGTSRGAPRYKASVSVGRNFAGGRGDVETSSQESIMGLEHSAKEVYVTRTVHVS